MIMKFMKFFLSIFVILSSFYFLINLDFNNTVTISLENKLEDKIVLKKNEDLEKEKFSEEKIIINEEKKSEEIVEIKKDNILIKEINLINDPIEMQLEKMSLDEKIGQMLIIGFENSYLDDHIKIMIEKYHIGGINLLRRNIKNEEQVKKLIKDLQLISNKTLLMAADQEGGDLIRFNFLKELTSQLEIKNMEIAEKVAFERSRELKDLGINMNFSPVIDYVSDKESYLYRRTFGTNINNISSLGNSMIDGYIKGGIIPVIKHFPGYGNVDINPHTKKAILNISKEEFELNLIPFREVIKKNPNVPIMTAHIIIPIFDSKPATISSKYLTKILREDLDFKGVIITDDIEMVSAGLNIEDIAVEAIKSGADMIISTLTPEKQVDIFNRLKRAVLDNEITEKRIDESVIRILELKEVI